MVRFPLVAVLLISIISNTS